MPTTVQNLAVTRAPRAFLGTASSLVTDAQTLAGILEDAAHYPGGHAAGLARPHDEASVAALLRTYPRVLAIGSQSSLTGGATPMGEIALNLEKFNTISEGGSGNMGIGTVGNGTVRVGTVRVGAGVVLETLQKHLAQTDRYYPPVPSYNGATIGGAIATNAAGPATFKYGSTRAWVQAITVILANGEALDLERGACLADPDFQIQTSSGTIRVPVPSYAMPNVPKVSAGYFAHPNMDLIDLFIGAEGTLGIITEATLAVIVPAPAIAVALIACRSEPEALILTKQLHDAGLEARETNGARGIDLSAIEYLDARSLELLREDGSAARNGVRFAAQTRGVLLVQLELSPEGLRAAYDDLADALEPQARDTPLVRFVRLLADMGVLDNTELALPDDQKRIGQLLALREAVPDGVNARVATLRQALNQPITKVGADMIVPFHHLEAMIALFRTAFNARGLDHAIWGHASDGNLHPNVIPRSLADVTAAKEAIMECGLAVIALGGCPLAEHGVGQIGRAHV